MILEAFLADKVFLLFSCVTPCSVDISSIIKHTSWCCFVFLATNNSSWLTWAFFVDLDVLYLLVHNFPIGSILNFSDCLEHRFFLLCTLLHFLPMAVHFSFPIPSILLVLLCYSFVFLLTMWFLLLVGFLWILWSLLLSDVLLD